MTIDSSIINSNRFVTTNNQVTQVTTTESQDSSIFFETYSKQGVKPTETIITEDIIRAFLEGDQITNDDNYKILLGDYAYDRSVQKEVNKIVKQLEKEYKMLLKSGDIPVEKATESLDRIKLFKLILDQEVAEAKGKKYDPKYKLKIGYSGGKEPTPQERKENWIYTLNNASSDEDFENNLEKLLKDIEDKTVDTDEASEILFSVMQTLKTPDGKNIDKNNKKVEVLEKKLQQLSEKTQKNIYTKLREKQGTYLYGMFFSKNVSSKVNLEIRKNSIKHNGKLEGTYKNNDDTNPSKIKTNTKVKTKLTKETVERRRFARNKDTGNQCNTNMGEDNIE